MEPFRFNLVWLASYPKSGNTWFRIFLTNYFRNEETPASINNLDDAWISSSRGSFDHQYGLSSCEMTEGEIELRRPALYDHWATLDTLTFHKAHDAYTYLPNGQPLMGNPKGQAALYFVRNPLDVAISYTHHNGHNDYGKTVHAMGHSQEGMSNGTHSFQMQLSQKLLTWSQHVLSWKKAPMPVHFIRYEDMLQNTYSTFFKALEFLGVTPEKERLEKAIRFSSFEEVKKQEQKEGFKEKPPKATVFFREGREKADKQTLLNYDQKNQLKREHSKVMNLFGYSGPS